MIDADCGFNMLFNRRKIVFSRGRISIKASLWKINSGNVSSKEKKKTAQTKGGDNDAAAL